MIDYSKVKIRTDVKYLGGACVDIVEYRTDIIIQYVKYLTNGYDPFDRNIIIRKNNEKLNIVTDNGRILSSYNLGKVSKSYQRYSIELKKLYVGTRSMGDFII